ncbi:response regulator [Sporosarcina limicola]|uniref:Two-component SAPR family response regulator n=1 Tax=Sporosarcina limicola TaxID=34101 RepID=A0A927MLC4_9BACL|nr:response regulator [Sporosarcina limicola]MBE1556480.1 two-component SAPR family response regulator [Sporosarcina limicola]
MNIVIIDDEKWAINVLSIILNKLTQFSICIKGTFTDAKDAFALLEKERIDIVFLDMEMVDIHGLDVAKKLLTSYPYVQIIFVTAHAQFAVDAFDVEATDYLLKPVRENRLITALKKAQKIYENGKETQTPKKELNLYAYTFGSFQLLDVRQDTVKWRTKKVRELFLYLWFYQKKPLLNTVIMEDLWPEIELEKAGTTLHTSVYHLRKMLKQNGSEYPILLVNNHYQLTSEIDSDYRELLQLVEGQQHNEQSIQQLLNCYEGDFLAEEEYPWAIQIRIRLKQDVLHLLETYITDTKDMNPLLKLNCLQKMLELDEFNEQYMFLLLQFLIGQNKKQACMQCYEAIQKKLQEELSVPVPEKINKLYAEYMMRV